MSAETLSFEQHVNATPEAVYTAWTNDFAARQWLCNQCQIDAREEGRLYLYWNQGYWASGEFQTADAPHSLSFTWHGRNEPAATAVDVRLAAVNGGTRVTVDHHDVGEGDRWQSARQDIADGWRNALANLASIFDSGLDKRIYDRPMMGIAPASVLTEEEARAAGVPGGLRISGTVPNTGAARAGLQPHDVIVRIDDVDLVQFSDLGRALGDKAVGDELAVTLLRDGEKQQMTMKMGGRPAFPVPETPDAFADALRDLYEDLTGEIESALDGVSENMAGQRPSPEAWSAREVLLHMVITEQVTQYNWVQAMYDRVPSNLPGDTPAINAAYLELYPTIDDLLDLWRHTTAQTVALVRHMPDSVRERPVTYQNWGTTYLFGLPFHTRDHIRQMEAALAEVREAVAAD